MSSEQTSLPSGLQLGTGSRPVATMRIHSQGALNKTGNTTDIAIKGQGFYTCRCLMVATLIPVMALYSLIRMAN